VDGRQCNATLRPSPALAVEVRKEFSSRWSAVSFVVMRAARAGNRRFWPLSGLHAHTKAPYKTDLHRKMRMALNRPGRARTVPHVALDLLEVVALLDAEELPGRADDGGVPA
jgi:hypothetical protein